MNSYKRGFTIVELLIVVVVIAILAAISIVAYSGIQARARSIAVRSDLTALAREYELFKVDNDRYPANATDLAALSFKVGNKAAYMTSGISHNLTSCASADGAQYALVAVTADGQKLYAVNGGGVKEYTGAAEWISGANVYITQCTGALSGSVALSGATSGVAGGVWRPWVD